MGSLITVWIMICRTNQHVTHHINKLHNSKQVVAGVHECTKSWPQIKNGWMIERSTYMYLCVCVWFCFFFTIHMVINIFVCIGNDAKTSNVMYRVDRCANANNRGHINDKELFGALLLWDCTGWINMPNMNLLCKSSCCIPIVRTLSLSVMRKTMKLYIKTNKKVWNCWMALILWLSTVFPSCHVEALECWTPHEWKCVRQDWQLRSAEVNSEAEILDWQLIKPCLTWDWGTISPLSSLLTSQ